ncbi:hypothetical protein FHX11_005973 [Rhizobium sp. BK602]|nr:hypothetical protein [Rhizobium sp. BK602]
MMTFASPEWISKECARHYGSLRRPLVLDPIISCLLKLTTRNKVTQTARSFYLIVSADGFPSLGRGHLICWFTTPTGTGRGVEPEFSSCQGHSRMSLVSFYVQPSQASSIG